MSVTLSESSFSTSRFTLLNMKGLRIMCSRDSWSATIQQSISHDLQNHYVIWLAKLTLFAYCYISKTKIFLPKNYIQNSWLSCDSLLNILPEHKKEREKIEERNLKRSNVNQSVRPPPLPTLSVNTIAK